MFSVNLTIGFAALAMGWRYLPEAKGVGGGFDWRAALVSGATFGLLVFGADTAVRIGWHWGLLLVVISAVTATRFFLRDWWQPGPLMPLDLLRNPVISL